MLPTHYDELLEYTTYIVSGNGVGPSSGKRFTSFDLIYEFAATSAA